MLLAAVAQAAVVEIREDGLYEDNEEVSTIEDVEAAVANVSVSVSIPPAANATNVTVEDVMPILVEQGMVQTNTLCGSPGCVRYEYCIVGQCNINLHCYTDWTAHGCNGSQVCDLTATCVPLPLADVYIFEYKSSPFTGANVDTADCQTFADFGTVTAPLNIVDWRPFLCLGTAGDDGLLYPAGVVTPAAIVELRLPSGTPMPCTGCPPSPTIHDRLYAGGLPSTPMEDRYGASGATSGLIPTGCVWNGATSSYIEDPANSCTSWTSNAGNARGIPSHGSGWVPGTQWIEPILTGVCPITGGVYCWGSKLI